MQVFWTEDLQPHGERALQQALGFGIAIQLGIDQAQVLHRRGHVHVLRSQLFFGNPQRTLVGRRGVLGAMQCLIDLAQPPQANGHVYALGPADPFLQGQQLPIGLLGVRMPLLLVIQCPESSQPVAGAIGLAHPRCEGQSLAAEDLGLGVAAGIDEPLELLRLAVGRIGLRPETRRRQPADGEP